jgi:hypothetical protein
MGLIERGRLPERSGLNDDFKEVPVASMRAATSAYRGVKTSASGTKGD